MIDKDEVKEKNNEMRIWRISYDHTDHPRTWRTRSLPLWNEPDEFVS